MTCIVGLRHKGKVWIGGDTNAGDPTRYQVFSRRDEKVFKNGKMLFGFTSSYRMGNILRYSLKIPKQPRHMDDMTYMNTLFIDACVKAMEEKQFAKKVNNVVTGGQFLVGYREELYEIDDDFQVALPKFDFSAVGSGYPYAIAALYNSQDKKDDPTYRITNAINTTAQFDCFVGGDITILNI